MPTHAKSKDTNVKCLNFTENLKKERALQFRRLDAKTELNTIERTGYLQLNTLTTFEGKKTERKRNDIVHAFTNILIMEMYIYLSPLITCGLSRSTYLLYMWFVLMLKSDKKL